MHSDPLLPTNRERPRHLQRSRRPTRGLTAAAGATALLAAGLFTAPSAHAFGDGSFAGSLLRGSANGGSASLVGPSGTLVRLGAIAKQSLGCNPALGVEGYKEDDEVTAQLNFLGSITLPVPDTGTALAAKQLRNSGYATANDAEAHVYERAQSSNVRLLNSMITATTLQQTAHTQLSALGYASDGDLIAQDLMIDPDGSGPQNASPVPDPEPNTRFELPGVGYVVFNEQIPNATGIVTNGIHVHVGGPDGESFGGFTGDIYVAHAETTVSKAPARISGFAYASKGSVAPFLASGKQALANLPCNGTFEKDKVSTAARVRILGPEAMPVLLDEQGLRSVVNAKTSKSSPYSRSTSTIEQVRLFADGAGLPRISAEAISTRAYTFAGFDRIAYDASGDPKVKNPITGIHSVGSMSIANLVVDGEPVTLAVDEPTTIELPGLGHVTFNEQRCRDVADTSSSGTSCQSASSGTDTHYNAITVVGVHVVVTETNVAGLPVGADIQLAVAHSDLAF